MSEVEAAKGSAWFTDTEHNVFLDSGDDLFPQEHVRNRFEDKVLDNFYFFPRVGVGLACWDKFLTFPEITLGGSRG